MKIEKAGEHTIMYLLKTATGAVLLRDTIDNVLLSVGCKTIDEFNDKFYEQSNDDEHDWQKVAGNRLSVIINLEILVKEYRSSLSSKMVEILQLMNELKRVTDINETLKGDLSVTRAEIKRLDNGVSENLPNLEYCFTPVQKGWIKRQIEIGISKAMLSS